MPRFETEDGLFGHRQPIIDITIEVCGVPCTGL